MPTLPQQGGQQVLRPRRTWTGLKVSTASAPNGHSILHTILGHNSGRTQVDSLTSAALAGLEGPLTRSLPCSVLLSLFPSVCNISFSGTPLHCMMVWGSSHVLHEGFKSPRSMKTHCLWHSVTLTCLNGPSGHRACPDSRGWSHKCKIAAQKSMWHEMLLRQFWKLQNASARQVAGSPGHRAVCAHHFPPNSCGWLEMTVVGI